MKAGEWCCLDEMGRAGRVEQRWGVWTGAAWAEQSCDRMQLFGTFSKNTMHFIVATRRTCSENMIKYNKQAKTAN